MATTFAAGPLAAPAPDGGAPGAAGTAPEAAAGTDVGTGGKSVAPGARAGAGAVATAGGGRDSFCHASHNISAENEKTTNRMRRWVSMTAWVTARLVESRGRGKRKSDQGTGSYPPG